MIWFQNRLDVLSYAASIVPDEGLVLEFGVASGATIRHLSERPTLRGRPIFGFDGFSGLPEPWGAYAVGHFACDPPVIPGVELVTGMFADTLPVFLAAHAQTAALIHLDCDLYSSVRLVLELLTPRIITGTVIALDEFFILPEHERRAFENWLTAHRRRYRPEARSLEQLVAVME
jgi:hypothetical protein